jgi:signal transduction histidine kinase
MNIQAVTDIVALCAYPDPKFLFFSENVPPLIYYSHIPIALVSLLVGLYVLLNDRRALANRILFWINAFFAIWVLLDSIFWAANRSDVIMLVWSLTILVEPLVYAGMVYLLHTVIDGKDISFNKKLLLFLLCLPVLLLVPTKFSLPGFNLTDCLSVEGFIGYYDYAIETLFLLWLVVFAFDRYRKEGDYKKKRVIVHLTTGAVLFLISFASGNLIGSFTGNWNIAQAGLFGMPIFIGFLAFSIVRYRTFNIRLIGAQALVTALAVINGAQLFYVQSRTNLILNISSFVLVLVFGYLLIKSVKNEIKAKENLQIANNRLKELDKQKTEFISFASHQLRSPLTAIRGNASLILEGDLGPISEKIKEVVQIIAASIKTQISIVEDYLNVSRIELGTMKYNFVEEDFKDVVKEAIEELKTNIEAKGLMYSFNCDESKNYEIFADPDKFKQVVMNVIDNSIKYTKEGKIDVSLYKNPERKSIIMKIADTGVGIRQDVMPKLFQKFSRAPQASEANIHGTGLGLFIAKEIMNAHKGRIWAESEGEGKGSQFYIEIPEAK